MASASVGATELHHVSQPADVLIASAAADRLAGEMGFPEKERAEIVLVVRELATNIVRHAGAGEIQLVAGPDVLEVVASDRGPGIADVNQAVRDGFSTAGSLGYGLGTVNRLMSEMDIASVRGEGTTVRARRVLRGPDLPTLPSPVAVGVATAAKPGFADNGDAFVVRSWDDRLLVGVIDGVGHGDLAHAAAQAARRYVETHYDQPLAAVMHGTDLACRGTRGVVMGLARLDWDQQSVEYCAIGNIEARLLGSASSRGFIVRRGILGVNAPAARATVHPWDPTSTLILHSDGIMSHWEGQIADDDLSGSAVDVANRMLARLNRGTDDATVLVVKGVLSA